MSRPICNRLDRRKRAPDRSPGPEVMRRGCPLVSLRYSASAMAFLATSAISAKVASSL